MKNLIFKYGITGGVISSIVGTLNWIFIAKPLGVSASQTVGYITIALSLLCVPLGIKYYRDIKNDGQIRYGQAFKIGLAITCVAALVMAVHSMIFFAFQRDEFIAWQKADLSDKDLEAFNEQLATMPEFAFTPLFQGLVMFTMVMIIGAVINLLSAWVHIPVKLTRAFRWKVTSQSQVKKVV